MKSKTFVSFHYNERVKKYMYSFLITTRNCHVKFTKRQNEVKCLTHFSHHKMINNAFINALLTV